MINYEIKKQGRLLIIAMVSKTCNNPLFSIRLGPLPYSYTQPQLEYIAQVYRHLNTILQDILIQGSSFVIHLQCCPDTLFTIDSLQVTTSILMGPLNHYRLTDRCLQNIFPQLTWVPNFICNHLLHIFIGISHIHVKVVMSKTKFIIISLSSQTCSFFYSQT